LDSDLIDQPCREEAGKASKVPKTTCLVRRKLFGSFVEAAAASLALPLAAAQPATHITRACPPHPASLMIFDSFALQLMLSNSGPSNCTHFVSTGAHIQYPERARVATDPELRRRVGSQYQDSTITKRVARSLWHARTAAILDHRKLGLSDTIELHHRKCIRVTRNAYVVEECLQPVMLSCSHALL
jgi:hypothetical protein